mgnify:CR=1 FL=1
MGQVTYCTEMYCFQMEDPYCLEYLGTYDQIVPVDCGSWYDGCNTCMVNNGEVGGCTKMMCREYERPYCKDEGKGKWFSVSIATLLTSMILSF